MPSAQSAERLNASSDAELAKLAVAYQEIVWRDIHKDRDCHWQIAERFSYGERVGWYIEHHGYLHELLDCEYGEDGPYRSREEALRRLAEHFRAAIAEVGSWQGG